MSRSAGVAERPQRHPHLLVAAGEQHEVEVEADVLALLAAAVAALDRPDRQRPVMVRLSARSGPPSGPSPLARVSSALLPARPARAISDPDGQENFGVPSASRRPSSSS